MAGMKTKSLKVWGWSALSAVWLAALPACNPPMVVASAAWGVSQAGTTAYLQGRLESAWKAPAETVAAATRSAFAELDYETSGEEAYGQMVVLRAKEVSGRIIEVTLEKSSSRVTHIQVRVGFWGDQAISRLVLDEMERALERQPPGELEPVPQQGGATSGG